MHGEGLRFLFAAFAAKRADNVKYFTNFSCDSGGGLLNIARYFV
jgi:hypothetical protein